VLAPDRLGIKPLYLATRARIALRLHAAALLAAGGVDTSIDSPPCITT